LVVVSILAVGASGTAFAKTINVPAQYATIQGAINAATTVNGDVVVVAEGTYVENINFKGKAITVSSTNPTSKAVVAATIIDGNKKGSVVMFNSAETAASVIEGFTLTNGSGTLDTTAPFAGTYNGGGVFCLGTAPTITNNLITGNSLGSNDNGAGVECRGARATITNNTISGNSAPNGGGGVLCWYGDASTLTNNLISGNSAAYGGGVNCYKASPTLTNNTISDNSAVGSNIYGSDGIGAGVYCYDASPTLTYNLITGNSATNSYGHGEGGGVYCSQSSSPTLANSLISGNSADDSCGGVYCDASSPTLTNDTISDNLANGHSNADGAGVFCGSSSSPIIKNDIIAFNTGINCSGVLSSNGSPVITYNDVYGNYGGQASNYGGMPDQTGTNGNISKAPFFVKTATGDFHLASTAGAWDPKTNAFVSGFTTSPCLAAGEPTSPYNNQPTPNGGRIEMGAYGDTPTASKVPAGYKSPVAPPVIITETGQSYTHIQAAINAAVNGDVVVVAEGTYTENINFRGKAITVQSTAPTNPAVVAKTIINGNKAGRVVTFNSGETAASVLTGFTLTNGLTATGGGGVVCSKSSPTLTYNLITGNAASGIAPGGGVYCSGSSPTLTNNLISGNSATFGGGVSCYAKSSPTLTNNTLSGNAATDGGGVYCAGSSSPIIKNTIIALSTKGGGLYTDGSGSPAVTYSDVYGNTGGSYVGITNQAGKNGNIGGSPDFANAAGGNFHLKSTGGRWNGTTWAIDTVTSPCIDAGDPRSPFNLEPAPNGGRINMGAYGDTIYASKSPTTTTSSAAALTVSAASAQGLAGGRQALVFTLSAPASVQAEIVNIAGRVIRELPVGDTSPAGVNALSWDGLSAAGTAVPNGVYLVRLVARTPDGAQAQAVVTCTVRR
jgi:regulator of RNase E activity RraA